MENPGKSEFIHLHYSPLACFFPFNVSAMFRLEYVRLIMNCLPLSALPSNKLCDGKGTDRDRQFYLNTKFILFIFNSIWHQSNVDLLSNVKFVASICTRLQPSQLIISLGDDTNDQKGRISESEIWPDVSWSRVFAFVYDCWLTLCEILEDTFNKVICQNWQDMCPYNNKINIYYTFDKRS